MYHRYVAVGGICVLGLLVGFGACVNPREGYAPEQPIKFSHRVHVAKNDIDCTYCHSKVTDGPHASVPGADTCMNCHATISGAQNNKKLAGKGAPSYQSEIKTLRERWKNGKSIEWKRVHNLPDHVQFSHQPHILQGIGCKECHGQIPKSSMEKGPGYVDRIAVENRFNMGWCVNCHRQPQNNAPVDCVTCHY